MNTALDKKHSYLSILIAALTVAVLPSLCLADDGSLPQALGLYAGIFSTVVTASVNPTATMAAISILGALENAATYQPGNEFFAGIADFLLKVPVVKEAAGLPVANPTAATVISVVAVIMYILHSFAESKAVSEVTVDKIEKWAGWLSICLIEILPLITTDDTPQKAISLQAEPYAYVIAAITLIVGSIVYLSCYECVDDIEVILAAIPVKGANFLGQIVKAVIHALLVILQIVAPVVSFILSLLIAVTGIILFKILQRLCIYYNFIYLRPTLRAIFRHNSQIALVHRKTPKKILKAYPDTPFSIPAFPMHGFPGTHSRTRFWMVKKSDKVLLVRPRLLRKSIVTELSPLPENTNLTKSLRFMKISTPDKSFELVISREYKVHADFISEQLNIPFTSSEN